jgi:hypothetical protein
MSARDTYVAAVKTAAAAQIATLQVAALVAQEAINVAGVGAGASSHPSLGVANGSTLDIATRNANASYAATRAKAEHDKQVAIENAKNVLRATGDTGA